MNGNTKTIIASLILLVVGYSAIFVLGARLDALRPSPPVGYEDEDIALQGARIKGYTVGLDGLFADWYWMQSLQYIGGKILRNQGAPVSIDNLNPLNPRLLHPYLDNATTLDPKFIAPYHYGAIVLPAIDKQKAIEIAEKGIRENPDDWRLYQYLGYIHWRLGDYDRAADVYERGAKTPGAPKFFQMMVAQVKSQGGSRQTARVIYQQMFDEADSDQARDLAKLRLLGLDSLDERDALKAVIAKFREQNGRCPTGYAEIVPLLRPVRLPAGNDFHIDRNGNLTDPTGVPYIFDTAKCEVMLDLGNSKIPE